MLNVDFSRLKLFIGDDKERGKDSCLVIKGFSCNEEVQAFIDACGMCGIFKPPEEKN